MLITRFSYQDLTAYGVLEEEQVFLLDGDLFGDFRVGPKIAAVKDVKILCPVEPSKLVAVGRNYAAHAAELDNQVPEEPLIFLKAPTTVIGTEERIIYPKLTQNLHYEGELALVIGKRARHIHHEEWSQYVLGYTCANDVTARDLQRKDGQWARAKSFDTFCPLGPYLAMVENGYLAEVNPSNARLQTRVNGQTRQDTSTSLMINKLPYLIEYISAVMTLLPGDVILTGTPEGVGPIQAGDVVEVEIEGLGVLRNQVMAEE